MHGSRALFMIYFFFIPTSLYLQGFHFTWNLSKCLLIKFLRWTKNIAKNLSFRTPISFQTCGGNLLYFKLRLQGFWGAFNFNCKHFLFVYIVKQKQKFRGFIKQFCGFSTMKIEFYWRQNFEILTIYKTFPRVMWGPTKLWLGSIQPFWRVLDTNGRRLPVRPE